MTERYILIADNHAEKFPNEGFDYRFKVFTVREEAERAAAKCARQYKCKFRVFMAISTYAAVSGEAEVAEVQS